MIENKSVVTKNQDIATIFNNFFGNITISLNIAKWNASFLNCNLDPVVAALEKFKSHPSVIAIEKSLRNKIFFEFSNVCYADTYHAILTLDSTKKTSGDIPTKILKVAI